MKESSKEKVIDSAQELFHKKGFLNTSIDDILESTGVTKSNLYYHFRSKEELGLIILEKRIVEYEKDFLSVLTENNYLTPIERLEKYHKKVIAHYRKLDYRYGCPFGNIALELSNINDKFRRRLSVFFDHWRKVFEKCIKEGIKLNEFRSDISTKILAGLILSHLEGSIMMTKTHQSIKSLNSESKALVKLLSPIT